jgi:hypothetical protein
MGVADPRKQEKAVTRSSKRFPWQSIGWMSDIARRREADGVGAKAESSERKGKLS